MTENVMCRSLVNTSGSSAPQPCPPGSGADDKELCRATDSLQRRRPGHFVTSMPAPVASGLSGSPGGACTRWKSAAFSRRTWRADIRTGFLHEPRPSGDWQARRLDRVAIEVVPPPYYSPQQRFS